MGNVEEYSQVGVNDYKKYSYYIILCAVVYLIFAYTMIFLVDFLNIFDLSYWFGKKDYLPELLWIHIFTEVSITEYIQWSLLGGSLLLAIYCRQLLIGNYVRSPIKWLFLQFGLLIMIAEDMVNIRHRIVFYFADISNINFYIFKTSIWGSLIEVSFYFMIGMSMLLFLFFILSDKKEPVFGKKLLLVSYFLYGLAAVGSATRHIGNWYAVAGERLLDSLISGFTVDWSAGSYAGLYTLGYWFMDSVIEESIELLAANFMLASIVAFIAYSKLIQSNIGAR